MRQNVILFGTGVQFSIGVLDNLLAYGLKPVALALPEYPPTAFKGLGETPVDTGGKENRFVFEAKHLSIPLIYLPEYSQTSQVHNIAVLKADFILVACWPYLIGPEIINAVNKAALNLHPSLLPNYRGVAPVTAQIDCQEKNLGVSLHLLSQEFDKGDIVAQARLTDIKYPGRELIEAEAARIGSSLFIKAIQDFGSPDWRPRPQCVDLE